MHKSDGERSPLMMKIRHYIHERVCVGILHLPPSFMNAYECKLNDMYIEYDNIFFFNCT